MHLTLAQPNWIKQHSIIINNGPTLSLIFFSKSDRERNPIFSKIIDRSGWINFLILKRKFLRQKQILCLPSPLITRFRSKIISKPMTEMRSYWLTMCKLLEKRVWTSDSSGFWMYRLQNGNNFIFDRINYLTLTNIEIFTRKFIQNTSGVKRWFYKTGDPIFSSFWGWLRLLRENKIFMKVKYFFLISTILLLACIT